MNFVEASKHAKKGKDGAHRHETDENCVVPFYTPLEGGGILRLVDSIIIYASIEFNTSFFQLIAFTSLVCRVTDTRGAIMLTRRTSELVQRQMEAVAGTKN